MSRYKILILQVCGWVCLYTMCISSSNAMMLSSPACSRKEKQYKTNVKTPVMFSGTRLLTWYFSLYSLVADACASSML